MLLYDEQIDAARLDIMLREELSIGEDNLDALNYLTARSRQNMLACGVVLVLLTCALGFFVYAMTSESSKFIAPVFEPFVVPVCVMLGFILYNACVEYKRISTELHQFSFFARRLERAVKRASHARAMP